MSKSVNGVEMNEEQGSQSKIETFLKDRLEAAKKEHCGKCKVFFKVYLNEAEELLGLKDEDK
jgi:hypothetical protein